jgi:hypothetical protein
VSVLARALTRPWAIGAAGAAAAGLWVVGLWSSLGWTLAFPLDDAYIHLQYARELAAGRPWSYDAADPMTTGATSTLWPILLAPGFWLGGTTAALAWAAAVSALAVGATGAAIAWAARPLASPAIAALAAVLALGNGWFLATGVSGMESAPIALSAALVLGAAVRDRPRLLAAGLVGLALTRPEGAVAAVAIAVAAALRRRRRSRLDPAVLAIPVAAALAQFGAWWAISGRPATDTAVSKSLFYDPLLERGLQVAAWLGELGKALATFVTGTVLDTRFLVPSFALAALAAAGASIAWRRGHRLFVLAAGAIALATLAIDASADWPAHNYRYLTAVLSALVLLAVPALDSLDRVPGGSVRLGVWAAAALAALTLAGAAQWHRSVVNAAADVNGQDVWVGRWLGEHLPPGSRVAFHDAGAPKFYSGLPHFDWLGLVTPDEASVFRHLWGSVYEKLERMAPEDRPDYFAMWSTISDIRDTPFITEPLVTTPDLGPDVVLGSRSMTVYGTDWSSLSYAGDPPAPLPAAAWELDVADLVSEDEGGYEALAAEPLRFARAIVAAAGREDGSSPVAEGCRPTVAERFAVPSGGTLVGRFLGPVSLHVLLDGRKIGVLAADPAEGTYGGASIELPAGGRLELAGDGGEYTSCHYWLIRAPS